MSLVIGLTIGMSDTSLEEQFNGMWKKYHEAIYKQCFFRVSCNAALAEDLTQKTFLQMWRTLLSGKPVEYPQAYLYRSLRFNIARHYRTRKNHQASLEGMIFNKQIKEPSYKSDGMHAGMDCHTLYEMIGQLEDPYRTLLRMRFVEDMDFETMRRLLSKGNKLMVQKQTYTALRKLQRLYAKRNRLGKREVLELVHAGIVA